MRNATVMNEFRRIQNILEKYLEHRKATNVALELSAVMQGETMESAMKEKVRAILNSYLKADKVQECIEQLMVGSHETKVTEEFGTIKVFGSDSPVYAKLLKHKPANYNEKRFINRLKEATSKSIKEFGIFVNDPSINNGKLQFVPGCRPAVGYSYNQWTEIAKKNGLRLGVKDEYIMFLGWLITSLINDGWSETDSWKAVCNDSKKLGHYRNSKDAKADFEVTGSREITGKFDLANAYKILAKDEEAGGFWLAGGCYTNISNIYPLADFDLIDYCNLPNFFGVGWLVF